MNSCILFDVTEQGNATHDPVIWGLGLPGWQHHCCDVIQVCSPRFLVDGADIELWIHGGSGVDGKHVDDWQVCE